MGLRHGRGLVAPSFLLVLACGRGKDARPAGESAASASSAPAAVAGASGKPPCPRTGHWTECIAFARLGQAGVAPRREGSIPDLPRLGPTPTVYGIGRNAIAVYLFADAASRARAAATLDTLHFIAPSASLTVRGEATAIQDDNLLALLYSRIDLQRERVSDAFMAGAPQK